MKNIGIFVFIIAMLLVGIFNILSHWDVLAKIPDFIANNPEYKTPIIMMFVMLGLNFISGIIAFVGFKPKK